MPETSLEALLERNERHVDGLPPEFFTSVMEGQSPAAVSICCSDSRVSQTGMWDVTEPGWLFTPSTIGNQVWDRCEGELVVDGSVLYPIHATETQITLVVGHTGCGAIAAALRTVREGESMTPPGLRKWISLLVPVVEAGLRDPRVDTTDEGALINQLVEYNVDQQIAFLLEKDEIPSDEKIYGFVYDFQGVYGTEPGRAYLVNARGETELDALRELVPDRFDTHVRRLLAED